MYTPTHLIKQIDAEGVKLKAHFCLADIAVAVGIQAIPDLLRVHRSILVRIEGVMLQRMENEAE
jgi:hypothetical protein